VLTIVYRLRALRHEPYSQKEAEAAVGLTTDNGKRSTTLMEVDGETAEVAG
jgi:bud site selection protein 20